jgi:hypothetical protein
MPSAVDMATELMTPITITNRIAPSFNPNHRRPIGSHAMFGRLCSPMSRGPTVSRTSRRLPIARPKPMPIVSATLNPMTKRRRLVAIAYRKVRSSTPSRSASNTCTGPGNR